MYSGLMSVCSLTVVARPFDWTLTVLTILMVKAFGPILAGQIDHLLLDRLLLCLLLFS